MERVARIELANKPWQGFRLPLHHTRITLSPPVGCLNSLEIFFTNCTVLHVQQGTHNWVFVGLLLALDVMTFNVSRTVASNQHQIVSIPSGIFHAFFSVNTSTTTKGYIHQRPRLIYIYGAG